MATLVHFFMRSVSGLHQRICVLKYFDYVTRIDSMVPRKHRKTDIQTDRQKKTKRKKEQKKDRRADRQKERMNLPSPESRIFTEYRILLIIF